MYGSGIINYVMVTIKMENKNENDKEKVVYPNNTAGNVAFATAAS